MNEKTNILVIDDDLLLLQTISNTLSDEGYSVIKAADGLQGLDILKNEPVDLIITDISMPAMNGYQLLEETQKDPRLVAVPFLFMSARVMDSDIRYGLELGADHYLRKPVNLKDLLAMVRGKLRRANKLNKYLTTEAASRTTSERLDIGRLHIHLDQHRVLMAGEEISLSATEFKLLTCLAQNANNVVSPQEIVNETHGHEADPIEASNLIRPLIRSVRRRLGYKTGDTGCIENVRGVGYKLIPPTGDDLAHD